MLGETLEEIAIEKGGIIKEKLLLFSRQNSYFKPLMTYQEAIGYLFSCLPMYQRIGKTAYKKDLDNTLHLCVALGNPHKKFKSVHIAGTNGKGSSAHFLPLLTLK